MLCQAMCPQQLNQSIMEDCLSFCAVFAEAWEAATGERLLQASGAPILKLHGNMPQARSSSLAPETKLAWRQDTL